MQLLQLNILTLLSVHPHFSTRRGITLMINNCKKYFEIFFRLKFFDLFDEQDEMANYLILSLQTDQVIPRLDIEETKMEEMENRLLRSMEKFNLTRLEMYRKIAVKCEEFIGFVREKSFGPNIQSWPLPCGDVFFKVPILTPFGTCFTTKKTIRWIQKIVYYAIRIEGSWNNKFMNLKQTPYKKI